MSLATIILAPLLVHLPGAAALEAMPERSRVEAGPTPRDAVRLKRRGIPMASQPDFGPFSAIAESFRAEAANQVRIEQRMTIRIAPRAAPVQPNFLVDLPSREVGPRFVERKIGKCVAISGIAGVQADGASRLLLFMRDRRIVSAALERACRAQDFYSGFYMSRTTDGQLCVDRDSLLSRSGANCKLTRLRQLVESGD
jgi:hypothetical protein